MSYFLAILTSLVTFLAFKFYQKVRVPEGLKNMPTLSFFQYVYAIIRNEHSPDKIWKATREVMEKEGIAKIWFNGEWAIMITNLDLVKEMLTNTELYPKSLLEESFPNSLLNKHYGRNVVFTNGDEWKRHRRITTPAFRNLPLHVFVETAMKLLEIMGKADHEPIEIKDLMHRLTLDVLGKASFGFNFNNLEDPKSVYVNTYNEAANELAKQLYFFISILQDIMPRTEARKKVAKLDALYDKLVEKKLELLKTGELDSKIENKTADLFERMLKASSDPENPTLTREELRHTMAIFMSAGHDTTANALTTIFYILAVHKDTQKKVRDELLRVLGDDLTPSMEQQKELKYMDLVINENLRLYPPIAQLLRRHPSRDVKYGNYVFPAKIQMVVNTYGIHHSPKYWENPEEFIPERFENENLDRLSMLSFGGASRLCLGINFSFIEQRTILCAILRKYEISLPEDSIHKDGLKMEPDQLTVGPYPIPLIFKRRTE